MTTRFIATRRTFLVGATAGLVAACGDSFYPAAYQTMKSIFVPGPDLPMTRAQVYQIPFASMAVRMGHSAQVLVILGRYDGDDLHWISADRDVVVTRAGRVVRTFGLPEDLQGTQFVGKDPVGRPMRVADKTLECERALDIEPGDWAGIPTESRFVFEGSETITILGTATKTDVWREIGSAPLLRWEFENRYWVEPKSGFVWKSLQHTTPNVLPMELTVYRAAKSEA